jgi:hypothetical protein
MAAHLITLIVATKRKTRFRPPPCFRVLRIEDSIEFQILLNFSFIEHDFDF